MKRGRGYWGGGLALILLAYLSLGSAYALNTPLWQAPDEPAHFNYVRDLAQGRGFPVLQMGDYDQNYMERITAARFPLSMSIDRIRYESHQPPLYYLLEAPVYRLMEGQTLNQQVLSLRIFSLFLGALLLAVIYRAVRQVFPHDPSLAIGMSAFVAFIPQHLHITGSINNDILGELLLSAMLLILITTMDSPKCHAERSEASESPQCHAEGSAASQRDEMRPSVGEHQQPGAGTLRSAQGDMFLRGGYLPAQSTRWWRIALMLGVILGLALLSKTTSYIALPLVPLGLAMGQMAGGGIRWGRLAATTATAYIVALAVSGWWFVRNLLVYGGTDIFGLARHDQIVVGQPRAGVFDWPAAGRFITVSFQSFWAQFGWMGVPSDSRTYAFAALFTLLAAAGLAFYLARELRHPTLSPYQRAALALLAVAFLLVLAGVVRYNLEFIQPQGRYFYPALLPAGLFAYLGLHKLMGRHPTLPMVLLSQGLFVLAAYNLWGVLIPGLR